MKSEKFYDISEENKENVIEQFTKDLQLRAMSPSTLKTWPGHIRAFQKFLGGKDLVQAKRADFKAYIEFLRNEKKLKAKSIGLYFVALQSFYDFLLEEDMIESNPLQGVKKRYLRKYKDEVNPRRALSIEEAQTLLSIILDTRDRAMVLMLLKLGLRVHELVDLDLEDLDLEKGELTLKRTAKRSNRVLPMDEELIRAVKRWLLIRETRNKKKCKALWISRQNRRIEVQSVEKFFGQYARLAGLDGITPHYCRYTFTTWLWRSGCPRRCIQELRGDAIKAAVDGYIDVEDYELKESYLAHIPQLGI